MTIDEAVDVPVFRSGLTAERVARGLVAGRSGGVCEVSGLRAVEWSHRVHRGMGGADGLWRASNGLHVAHRVHQWIHANPRWARDLGWLLRRDQDPAEEPAWLSPAALWAGWWRLGDDGMYTAVDREVPETPEWATR